MSTNSLFTVSAPGKVILFGEHAVVYDKAAIAVSVDLQTRLQVKVSTLPSIELYVDNLNLHRSWKIRDLANLPLSSGNAKEPQELSPEDQQCLMTFLSTEDETGSVDSQAEVALLFLFKYILGLTYCQSGLRFEVKTELPIGAGLGSSASFSVCLSAALLYHAGILDTCKSSVCDGQPLQDADLELINRWAYMAEKVFHGRPSGIDNSICTFGGGVSYRSGQFSNIQMPSDLRILLVNTGIPRRTKDVVAKVRRNFDKYPDILNPIFTAIDNISNYCVEELKHVVQSGSTEETYTTLEDLITLNHGLLRTLGVSHEKLEDIVSTAAEFSLGAKLTGAGAGGFAFILLSPGKSNVDQQLKQKLHDQGFQSWEVGIGGNGVRIKSGK